MQRKSRRGANWNKDVSGMPINRSKSWGEKKDKDPKKNRRDWRKGTGVTYDNNL